MRIKTGFILQRYTAWNAEINDFGRASEGFIRGMGNVGRNLFLPAKWAASGRYRHQEDLAYITFTHAISPRTFYEVRAARSRTLQDTVGVPMWTEDPRKERDGWFNLQRNAAMWVDSDRKRYSLKVDLTSQANPWYLVKAGSEITGYDAYYTYWAARQKVDNHFTFYSGGDTPWLIGSPARPIRGAFYIQNKMEFAGLIVNAGVRLDFNKHTHEELLEPAFMWAPMWRFYTHRHYGYGTGAGEGVAVTGDLASMPPTQVYLSPRLGVSHPISDKAVLHYSIGRLVQWIDLFDLYAKPYGNYGRSGPAITWRDVNDNGVKDPAEHLNVMQPLYAAFGSDAWAHPEETLAFEVGADWAFAHDYTASLTLYYRSETQQLTHLTDTWRGPKHGSHYVRGVSNGAMCYAKGFELSVGKRLGGVLGFRVAWSSMWTAIGGVAGLTQGAAGAFQDSIFVAGPEFWYDFRPNPDGSETPLPLTEIEKADLCSQANQEIRSRVASYGKHRDWSFGKAPQLADKGIYIEYRWPTDKFRGVMQNEQVSGILGQANAQLVLITPPDVGMGARWVDWLASDLKVNLLWRLRTGVAFRWTPPGGRALRRRGPVNTVTDLSVEKGFITAGRFRTSLFAEIRNLFGDRICSDAGDEGYMRWGLQMRPPDSPDFLEYGEEYIASDLRSTTGGHRFFQAPRQWNVGVRVVF
ncbi:MAG: hypothetical protein QGI83_01145 [Candidatus Latescibacteria bacterium]|nr:hypothetical protein [Candidatus Latescibacterota bacterium]